MSEQQFTQANKQLVNNQRKYESVSVNVSENEITTRNVRIIIIIDWENGYRRARFIAIWWYVHAYLCVVFDDDSTTYDITIELVIAISSSTK